MTEKNPMGLRLETQPERTTGQVDYELVEKDGGKLTCPLRAMAKAAGPKIVSDTGCDTNCAWFFTLCNVPENLDLEVQGP